MNKRFVGYDCRVLALHGVGEYQQMFPAKAAPKIGVIPPSRLERDIESGEHPMGWGNGPKTATLLSSSHSDTSLVASITAMRKRP